MAEQEFSFCPYCGAKLNPEDVVCPNCGKKLPKKDEDVKPNKTWAALSHLFGNPYKEGMSRYRAEKAAEKHKKKD
ncbi:Double zinc ribbon [Lentilactobacillus parabuchneri]|jgi:predicted amidophosphoribosyltransferase|uniref:Double zinc ribbon n=2 Tax=Lentilactobacillus parabuchneri TaxID=152331 RepID=A0A1X1FEF0_9LACO|nr:zinc ribbon domain-containing protein [Lentilactobacillus parabuchneri]APR07627.1 Double zinc ribbon [Lentilactobacillus parabuchneri]KRM46036.1 hypothetical protein FC51_GL000615 [Lentilactobacillus parabuchneri DSM 5707 = NBRC 107865]KRN72829.1 hypothetical protein IV42_GL001304 [Lentilactobacillus parabuchneri]MBW0222897.1 zinc ribbon domain-containing protein [Lentilactobacillus parabuchneri]MBW0246000.1 zinc ribbon domain-containing protein [Lentilactobacillus parabuchneri]